MTSLLLRSLLYTLLLPGVVTGLIPYLILKQNGRIALSSDPALLMVGLISMTAGLAVLIRCIIQFAVEGNGTLSASDPTLKLVHTGLYQYTRNPMYMGVILILSGESILTESIPMLVYLSVIFVVFNLYIIYFEEPRLKKDFGKKYTNYCLKVRRWI